MTSAWMVWGPEDLARFTPLALAIMLCIAVGAPRSGSLPGWLATLGLVWRRQVALAVPSGLLAVGGATFLGGAPWSTAKDVFLRPSAAVLMLSAFTLAVDSAARRASRRVLATRAKDLPPLATADDDGIAAFERGSFSDDVGAAVIRLAEREPGALEGIARAATRVG
jgi:hypothetical protein